MKRSLIVLVGLLLVAGLATARPGAEASGAKGAVTLKVLTPFDVKVIGEEYLTAFDKASAELGTKLNQENIDSETYKTRIRVALAGNELPDIFFTWGDSYTLPFIEAKALLPLNAAIKESGNQYFPSYVIPHTDGNLYTAPYTSNDYYVILYNKAVFQKLGVAAPKNIDDIVKIVDAANKAGIYAIGLANGARWQGDLLYNQLVLREDPMAFKNAWEGKGSFTDKPFLEAAKKVKQLVDAGAFQKGYMQATEPEMWELFYADKIAMHTIGSWAFAPAIENMGDKLGYVLFPKTGADADYAKSSTCMFGALPNGLCVAAKTAYPNAASKFVVRYSYYVNEAIVKKGRLGFIKTATQPDKPMHPAYAEYVKDAQAFSFLQPWWFGAVPPEIGEPMRDLSHKQFAGAISPEEFVQELQKVMTKGR